MKINNILYEVEFKANKSKTRDGGVYSYDKDQKPLKDSDTIRVYSGVNSRNDFIEILNKGLSGKERAPRRYSYESDNNPYGLFVTLDLDVAKSFGQYVLEFHTRVSDLESPVWPGGTWTVQGGMSDTWKDKSARENARLKKREETRADAPDSVIKSDRPELAASLYSLAESQALFTGQLDPNSIRAVWVNPDPNISSSFSTFQRMKPKRFLDTIKVKDKKKEGPSKIAKPREIISFDEFISRLHRRHSHIAQRDKIINIVKNNPEIVNQYLWDGPQKDRINKEINYK